MNIDEINGLLQDDNDDILFDSTEDEDFRGFSFNMELYQMVIMNAWLENQGDRRCEELMSVAIIIILWEPWNWRQWVGCMVWFMRKTKLKKKSWLHFGNFYWFLGGLK